MLEELEIDGINEEDFSPLCKSCLEPVYHERVNFDVENKKEFRCLRLSAFFLTDYIPVISIVPLSIFSRLAVNLLASKIYRTSAS